MGTREQQAALKEFLDITYPQARDFFELLGVHRGSSEADINAERNRLARALHPDRWEQDARRKPKAETAMSTVTMAAAILTTKDKRLKYMAELASGRSKCATCKGEGYTTRQRGFKNKDILRCTVCGGSGLYKDPK